MGRPMSVWLKGSRVVVTVGERHTPPYLRDYAFKLLESVATDDAFTRYESGDMVEYCRDCQPSFEVEAEPCFTCRADFHEYLGYIR